MHNKWVVLGCACWMLIQSGCGNTNTVSQFRREVVCPGSYGGHLQGVAIDETNAIYWSFTVDLVKTDSTGKILRKINVPTHHGDLVCHDGKVYVAVNLGEFNQEPGKADSWIYVYDADDLKLLTKHKVPELVHGAGGMAYHDGRFIVVGGLPEGYQENYAYEYDQNFRFIKRHVIHDTGYTIFGIQTACYFDGYWWFGCYGDVLLQTDQAFRLTGRYDATFGCGIVGLAKDKFLRGVALEGNKGKIVVSAAEQRQ